MESRSGRRVRSLLIEPFQQIRFGIYVLALTFVFAILLGWLFVLSFVAQYEHVMTLFNVVSTSAKWSLIVNEVFIRHAWEVGSGIVSFVVLMFLLVFKLTHNYYGPLVAIRRFVSEIKAGNYAARVTIRKSDDLQTLVDELNQMAETLESRYNSRR